MDTSELKTWKLICEVRFPGSVAFFDKRSRLVESFLTEQFSKWRLGEERVEVFSDDRRFMAFSSHLNAGLMVEKMPTVEFFHDHLIRWLKILFADLGIDRLNRIGVRSLMVLPQPDFAALVSLFRREMLNEASGLWGNFGLEPVDLGLRFVFQDGPSMVSLGIGPMKRFQVLSEFENAAVREELPDVCVFADFDYVRTEPEFDKERLLVDIGRFVTRACEQAHRRTSSLLTGMGG